jgi:transposase
VETHTAAVESRVVGPLPALLGLLRSIGLAEVINAEVRWDPARCRLSPGERIEALVVNILAGQRPLYRVCEFFRDTAAEVFLPAGVTPAQLNDDCLARGLDYLAEAGPRRVYSAVALRACLHEGVAAASAHFDTTSVSLYGEYPDSPPEGLQLVRGFNKDGHPELKQLVLALLCNREGVPLRAQVRDGNSPDCHANLDALDDFCAALSAEERARTLWVADSALVTGENLERIAEQGLRFVSRLPERFGAAQTVKDAAWAAEAWTDLGVLAWEPRPDSARYRVWEQRVEIAGRPYRAIAVHTTARVGPAEDWLEQRLKRERERLDKVLAQLARERFACAEDAQAAAADCTARHLLDALHQVQLRVQSTRRRLPRPGPGRPRRGEPARWVTDWWIQGTIADPLPETLERERRRRSTFVLLTNELDAKAYPAERLLREYRDQVAVEQRFHFLKDPVFVSGVYLHTPRRSEALGYVFVLACLAYSILERRVRQELARRGRDILVPGRRRTRRPTAKMLLDMLQGLTVARLGRGPWRHSSPEHMTARAADVVDLAGLDFAALYRASPP